MKSNINMGENLIKLLLLKERISELLAYRICDLSVEDKSEILVVNIFRLEVLLLLQLHEMLIETFGLRAEDRKDTKLIDYISSIIGSKLSPKSPSLLFVAFQTFFRFFLNLYEYQTYGFLDRDKWIEDAHRKLPEIKEHAIKELRSALTPYLIAEITSLDNSQNTYFTPNHYYHLMLASAARSKKLKSMSERDKMQSAYKILSKFKAIEKEEEEKYKRNKNEVPLCF
jgi:hypothetical protein